MKYLFIPVLLGIGLRENQKHPWVTRADEVSNGRIVVSALKNCRAATDAINTPNTINAPPT